MSSYSVAAAKNGLPALIDRALSGEEVLITRHGRVVAELRPALPRPHGGESQDHDLKRLAERRRRRPPLKLDTARLLRDMADEKPW